MIYKYSAENPKCHNNRVLRLFKEVAYPVEHCLSHEISAGVSNSLNLKYALLTLYTLKNKRFQRWNLITTCTIYLNHPTFTLFKFLNIYIIFHFFYVCPTWVYWQIWCFPLLHVQVSLEKIISLKMTILPRQSFTQRLGIGTNGVLGLSTQRGHLLSKVQQAHSSGGGSQTGPTIEIKNGILQVKLSLMVSHVLLAHILIEECWVCLQQVL